MTDKTENKRGRPGKPGGADKSYTVRLPESIIDKLDRIAAEERDKTGYSVERSDIIRRALIDFIAARECGQ